MYVYISLHQHKVNAYLETVAEMKQEMDEMLDSIMQSNLGVDSIMQSNLGVDSIMQSNLGVDYIMQFFWWCVPVNEVGFFK